LSSLRIRVCTLWVCLVCALLPTSSVAQAVQAGPDEPPPSGLTQRSTNHECVGCPAHHVRRALLATAGISFFYHLGNRIRGEETAKLSLSSWGANIKSGFEWDDDPFGVNQFGHPYQGSNYFNAGRANGMTFWESSALTAFGAASWELFGETNKPSMNDLINTTLGGIALGEMFHRTAWLVRDPSATGKTRWLREITATVLDPVTSATRFISRDASRVSEKPESVIPSSHGVSGSAGALWQGSNVQKIEAHGLTFVDVDLLYGDLSSGHSRTPYDAFLVHFRAGGGRAVSEARVRGRLLGQPLGSKHAHQLTIAQTYDYVSSAAYLLGAQGFEAASVSSLSPLPGLNLVFGAWGGVLALGAVDAVRPETREGLPLGKAGPTGQAGRKDYDIGPGTSFGGTARLFVRTHPLAGVTYQGYQIVAVGPGRNHVLQRVQIDVRLPLRRRLDVGTAAEFFYRKTYFPDGGARRERLWQFRMYLGWSLTTIRPARVPVQ
jgi:hypothetical protein